MMASASNATHFSRAITSTIGSMIAENMLSAAPCAFAGSAGSFTSLRPFARACSSQTPPNAGRPTVASTISQPRLAVNSPALAVSGDEIAAYMNQPSVANAHAQPSTTISSTRLRQPCVNVPIIGVVTFASTRSSGRGGSGARMAA